MIRNWTFALLAVAVVSCKDNSSQPEIRTVNSLESSQDVKRLSFLIHLPGTPIRARWLQTSPQRASSLGPQDYTLIAVVEYTSAEFERLIPRLGPPTDNEPVTITIPEAIALFGLEQANSFARVNGALVQIPGNLRGASLFAKAPFLNGKVVVLTGKTALLVNLFTS